MGELIERLIKAKNELNECSEMYGARHLSYQLEDAEREIDEYILDLVKGAVNG